MDVKILLLFYLDLVVVAHYIGYTDEEIFMKAIIMIH